MGCLKCSNSLFLFLFTGEELEGYISVTSDPALVKMYLVGREERMKGRSLRNVTIMVNCC